MKSNVIWKASLLRLFWYLFETENQINLDKNITQLHLLPMIPTAWEMWTQSSVKWSSLRQKTLENYLSALKGPQRHNSFTEEATNDRKQC